MNFAILFTIADMCWLENKINACYIPGLQKIRNKNFIHPLLFTQEKN